MRVGLTYNSRTTNSGRELCGGEKKRGETNYVNIQWWHNELSYLVILKSSTFDYVTYSVYFYLFDIEILITM